jgi:hypothetical protein
MTRYSNPLPQNQVPNSQGRPAGPGQHQHPGNGAQQGHAAQALPGNAGPARQPAPGYANPGHYASEPHTGGRQAAGTHDLYAALRPDGYGYTQPPQQQHQAHQQHQAADPYGLAGYTAPQPAAAPPYGARGQQAAAQPAYAPSSDAFGGYPPAGQQTQPSPYGAVHAAQPHAYGAQPQHGYGQHQAEPSFAPQGYGGAQPAGGYAPALGEASLNSPADQWGAPGLALDTRDYGHAHADGAYGAQGQWGGDLYGEPPLDPALGQGAYHQGAPQAQHGAFDQSYAEDDAQYDDEPRRGGWKKVAVIMACTVFVGGVLTFAYGSIMGTNSGEPTPLVKGASGPSKVKPSDPGGKQFAHADSKIMGRLGEGSEEPSDVNGVRKVPVVNVGRDGSIQAPAAGEAPPQEETRAVVAVPGLTVIDGLGAPTPMRQASPSAPMITASEPPRKTVVVEPPKKQAPKSPNLIANAGASEPSVVQTKAVVAEKEEAPAPPKKERVAVAAPTATGPQPTGAGYVAVLASVPASGSSRMDALKQFADMQQKYSTILSNKTPDIQEANLGEKGTYHRLMVGPPGSRDSASSVCTQLKAEGYSGCWVTAY